MADAFIYFFFIGSGTASGFAVVAFISWKVVQRSQNKQPKSKKKVGVRNVV